VAVHEELRRHAVELLADLLADALEGLAAGAVRLVDLVVVLDARQLLGQRLAYRRAPGARRGVRRRLAVASREVFEGGVGQDALEQHGLRARRQALAGRAEAPALQARDLEVQRFDLGPLELDLALQPLDQLQRRVRRCIAGGGRRIEHGRHRASRAGAREAGLSPMDNRA
jgi:hypothetical protein